MIDPARIIAVCFIAIAMVATGAAAQDAARPPGAILQPHDTLALQHEAEDKATGRYDWGPSVMYDGGLYKMWWVRLGGTNEQRFPYAAVLPDGVRFEFTYPDWGDRVYYAESRDGRRWHLDGADYTGPKDQFGPDAEGPLMVVGPAETDQERNHIGCPSVVKVAGTYYMYYEAPSGFIVTRRPDGQVAVGDEYHNQVFVATSKDGKEWHKHPDDRRPQPIVRAPDDNRKPGRQRYGLGQPSVFHRNGRFVMHYVDSCTGPGDFIVRLEADNPYFEKARRFDRSLRPSIGADRVPAGSVARFAQTDVKPLAGAFYLLRPAYGTRNVGILATRTGVFTADANASQPGDVFPQIAATDPRGPEYSQRLYPRFLSNPSGEIRVEGGHVTIYYSSGRGWKEEACTWDVLRCDIALSDLQRVSR